MRKSVCQIILSLFFILLLGAAGKRSNEVPSS
jgi:hypothetical protein